jgi:DNA-binding transcriptional LysR family regulator
MLNPLWLKTFRTLIETGHFTHTAEKLYMTQPGVSQHIKKLEVACGHALISRDKKSFEITEQGRVVYDYAKQLEQQEAELLNALSEDSAHEGEVSISCSGEMALLLYPELLELQCQYPELVSRMEAAPNKKILDDLLDCKSDLGLVTHVPSDPRIEAKKIGYEPLCLMYPSGLSHSPLTPEALYSLGVIDHPNAEHYLSLYFSQCGEDELSNVAIEKIPVSGYVNQLSQILLPVAKGLGFTVLPLSALSRFEQRDSVEIYRPAKEVVENIYLASKKSRVWPARFYTIAEKIEATVCASVDGKP